MTSYNVILKVSLFVDTDDGVDIEEVINELDYDFRSQTAGATITDTEIQESEVSEFEKRPQQNPGRYPADKGEDGFYRLVDYPTPAERQQLGLPITLSGSHLRDIMACATGELRPPRKGEWYLSGAIVEAYRAISDMDRPLHIAKLVRVRRKTIVERI